MPTVSLLYLGQMDKAIGSVPVTLLMGLSLQVCEGGGGAASGGIAAEGRALHSDSTSKPRGTKKTSGVSCSGET